MLKLQKEDLKSDSVYSKIEEAEVSSEKEGFCSIFESLESNDSQGTCPRKVSCCSFHCHNYNWVHAISKKNMKKEIT